MGLRPLGGVAQELLRLQAYAALGGAWFSYGLYCFLLRSAHQRARHRAHRWHPHDESSWRRLSSKWRDDKWQLWGRSEEEWFTPCALASSALLFLTFEALVAVFVDLVFGVTLIVFSILLALGGLVFYRWPL